MLKNFKEEVYSILSENRLKLIFVISVLFLGIIGGSIFCGRTDISDGFAYMDRFLSSYKAVGSSPGEIMASAFFSYLKIFAVIWISSKHRYLIFLNPIAVAARGFSLGYTIAYFMYWKGFNGIITGILIMTVQNVLLIPAILIYSVYELDFSLRYAVYKDNHFKLKQNKYMRTKKLYIFLAIFSVIFACGCIDAYVIPSVIMPILIKI